MVKRIETIEVSPGIVEHREASGVLTSDRKLSTDDIARIRAAWNEAHCATDLRTQKRHLRTLKRILRRKHVKKVDWTKPFLTI